MIAYDKGRKQEEKEVQEDNLVCMGRGCSKQGFWKDLL